MAQMMGTFNSGGARLEQLNRWLQTVLDERSPQLSPASADASFRRYFRVLPSDETSGETYICMDAPVAQEDTRPFITVAAMLGAAGIEVPTVLEANVEEGFLLLRDLGSQTYLDALSAGEAPGPLYEDAIVALATMHGAVDAAALPPYDAEYLQYEMGMFDEWFTSKLLGLELDNRQTVLLAQTRDALVAEALTSPQGFVHRDYHSRNLMVSEPVRPGVLDFQDAMHGPMVYDLVSLLRDSYVRWPAAAIDEWIALYRELAESRGVPVGSPAEFRRRFDLVGAQRHLKVCGDRKSVV